MHSTVEMVLHKHQEAMTAERIIQITSVIRAMILKGFKPETHHMVREFVLANSDMASDYDARWDFINAEGTDRIPLMMPQGFTKELLTAYNFSCGKVMEVETYPTSEPFAAGTYTETSRIYKSVFKQINAAEVLVTNLGSMPVSVTLVVRWKTIEERLLVDIFKLWQKSIPKETQSG